MAQSFFNERVSGWPLALLRIALGSLWLVAVSGKLAHLSQWPAGLHGYLEGSSKAAFGFYRGFLGLAAAVGLFMVLNFWFMKGATFWDPTNHDSLFIMILFALMFTQCGRVLGLDYFLAKKKPNGLLW